MEIRIDGVFNGSLDGNLGRNAGVRPMTIFTDMRIAKFIKFGERMKLEGSVDAFNFINRFNVADVNSLYTEAGQPTAAFDPRQFQFGLRMSCSILKVIRPRHLGRGLSFCFSMKTKYLAVSSPQPCHLPLRA